MIIDPTRRADIYYNFLFTFFLSYLFSTCFRRVTGMLIDRLVNVAAYADADAIFQRVSLLRILDAVESLENSRLRVPPISTSVLRVSRLVPEVTALLLFISYSPVLVIVHLAACTASDT